MTDRMRALLSGLIGSACVASAMSGVFGLEQGFTLLIGLLNLSMAVWLLVEARS